MAGAVTFSLILSPDRILPSGISLKRAFFTELHIILVAWRKMFARDTRRQNSGQCRGTRTETPLASGHQFFPVKNSERTKTRSATRSRARRTNDGEQPFDGGLPAECLGMLAGQRALRVVRHQLIESRRQSGCVALFHEYASCRYGE